MRTRSIDKRFLALVLILTLGGFFIFTSASFKVLSTTDDGGFFAVLANQFLLGVVGGLIALTVASTIKLHHLKKYSPWIFLASVFGTLLVFIPDLGISVGGARRWIEIGPLSFQPSEFLKLGSIIFAAALLSNAREHVHTFSGGFLPIGAILAVAGAVLLSQPDTDTFAFIVFACLAMYIVAGARWKHLGILVIIGMIIVGILVQTRPYLKERFQTFLNPQAADSLGSGYQIEQSLIAIGSGGFFGRGFGQSIQKFGFLPEPTTDSIFAVAAEEFGFVGSIVILAAFATFGLFGLSIARSVPDSFGRFVTVGLITLIVSESFVNIAAMTGIIPLAGTPLLFVSHGGTALFFTLAACGIVLNVSRYQRQSA